MLVTITATIQGKKPYSTRTKKPLSPYEKQHFYNTATTKKNAFYFRKYFTILFCDIQKKRDLPSDFTADRSRLFSYNGEVVSSLVLNNHFKNLGSHPLLHPHHIHTRLNFIHIDSQCMMPFLKPLKIFFRSQQAIIIQQFNLHSL